MAVRCGLRMALRPNKRHSMLYSTVASTNPPLSFPCLDKAENRTKSLESGPEPAYSKVSSGYETYHSGLPLHLTFGGRLTEFDIAYETWGKLNSDRSNAILLHTGLSASSHAKSHTKNPKPGWWEKFIGPGLSIDTDKYFVICTNVLGGCYGSTGPASLDPSDGKRYATRFPIISIFDMVRAQQRLLEESFKIQKLYASVGSSMGGMQSLAFGREFPDKVGRIVSISGCVRAHPYSIAMRHTQRQVLMADPNWRRGFYYDSGVPPHLGMKLAREIATITYRSGPEWEQRFGRQRADPAKVPALCPDFLIETYLDHQGEKFCLEYDPNSLLYVSKAMDIFDLGQQFKNSAHTIRETAIQCPLPENPYEEQQQPDVSISSGNPGSNNETDLYQDLKQGMSPLKGIPTLVLGVSSDLLFPSWQQQEIYTVLKDVNAETPNIVKHMELGEDISLYGHDTFLLDVENVGGPVKQFLEGF